jgi:hypothetical protein
MKKQPKYIFSKDPSGNYNWKVEINHNGKRIFVMWLAFDQIQDGETKPQACDRMIAEGGFEDRIDLFEYQLKLQKGA